MLRDIPKGLASTVRSIYEKSVQEHVEQKKVEAARLAELREAKKSHTVPKTDKEKSLASLAEPKDKITHADVMVGRGVKKEEVEQLGELSKPTLGSYVKKAAKDASEKSSDSAHYSGVAGRMDNSRGQADMMKDISNGLKNKSAKRLAGINKAVSKMSESLEDYTLEELEVFMQSEEAKQLDELSYDTLNSYMRKKRRKLDTTGAMERNRGTPKGDKMEKDVANYRKAWAKRDMKEETVEEQSAPANAFSPNYKSQAPTKPGEKAGFDSKKTSTGTVYTRKPVKEETDTPGNSEHQCAIHVKHAKLGEGRTLFSQHAEPDESGFIAWYDVMFAEGIEKKVPTEDLEILVAESHMNHKKKK